MNRIVSYRIGWDRGLDVAADGRGLVGQAGVVLLRRLADRVGLTGELAKALPSRRLGAGLTGASCWSSWPSRSRWARRTSPTPSASPPITARSGSQAGRTRPCEGS